MIVLIALIYGVAVEIKDVCADVVWAVRNVKY